MVCWVRNRKKQRLKSLGVITVNEVLGLDQTSRNGTDFTAG